MATFISIPVTNKGNSIVSTEGLSTSFVSATSIVLGSGGKTLTLTMAGTATPAALTAINNAALQLNCPVLADVVFPTGQTCTGIAIS
jgi:hypothetical protein